MILILNRKDMLRVKAEADLATIEDLHLKYSMYPIERADLVLLQDGFHGPFKVLKSRITELTGQVLEYDAMNDLIQSHI